MTEAQRAFIRRMLGFSNFNKHLAAVRETHAMLWATQHVSKQEVGPTQALPMASHIRWMQEHSVVQQLLRSNLHQKQYVEQVGVTAGLKRVQPLASLPWCLCCTCVNPPEHELLAAPRTRMSQCCDQPGSGQLCAPGLHQGAASP